MTPMSDPIELTLVEHSAVLDRAQAIYERVKLWPENRMRPGAVTELGPGFNDLLLLRNLVPELITAARAGLEAGKAGEDMRERAAQVAEEHARDAGDMAARGYYTSEERAARMTGRGIATAIRSLPLTTGGAE